MGKRTFRRKCLLSPPVLDSMWQTQMERMRQEEKRNAKANTFFKFTGTQGLPGTKCRTTKRVETSQPPSPTRPLTPQKPTPEPFCPESKHPTLYASNMQKSRLEPLLLGRRPLLVGWRPLLLTSRLEAIASRLISLGENLSRVQFSASPNSRNSWPPPPRVWDFSPEAEDVVVDTVDSPDRPYGSKELVRMMRA